MKLVERVGAQTDRQEEGRERRHEPVEVHRRRRGGSERHVAQVPQGVGRVEDRDQVAPPAGAQRVEGGAAEPLARRRLSRHRACPRSRPRRRGSSAARGHRPRPPRATARAGARAAIARRAPRCSGPRKRPTRHHSRPPSAKPAAGSSARVYSHHSGRQSGGSGRPNSSEATRPPGLTTRASSRERRRRVLDVAEQVGEGQMVELAVAERQRLRLTPHQLDARRKSRIALEPPPCPGEHVGALVESDDAAAVGANERLGHEARAGRDVEDAIALGGADGRHHRPPPARVLAEAEERPEGVVARGQPREELERLLLATRSGWHAGDDETLRPGRADGGEIDRPMPL